jgi:hypothetical protein
LENPRLPSKPRSYKRGYRTRAGRPCHVSQHSNTPVLQHSRPLNVSASRRRGSDSR